MKNVDELTLFSLYLHNKFNQCQEFNPLGLEKKKTCIMVSHLSYSPCCKTETLNYTFNAVLKKKKCVCVCGGGGVCFSEGAAMRTLLLPYICMHAQIGHYT